MIDPLTDELLQEVHNELLKAGLEATLEVLQRFALKPEPRIILKALLRNAFKIILVVRLIGDCCKRDRSRKTKRTS
jgi:hypothetical protein